MFFSLRLYSSDLLNLVLNFNVLCHCTGRVLNTGARLAMQSAKSDLPLVYCAALPPEIPTAINTSGTTVWDVFFSDNCPLLYKILMDHWATAFFDAVKVHQRLQQSLII